MDMKMKEFNVNGIKFAQMPLDTFTQFHLCIEAAPMCVELNDNPFSMAMALSRMERDKLDGIIKTVMPFVKRFDELGNVWASVYTQDAGFMYSDLSAGTIIGMISAVLGEYLPDFLRELDQLI